MAEERPESAIPEQTPATGIPYLDESEVSLRRPLQVIAVAGAKGGVGKTIVATNLGLYLATIGRDTVIVDADPSGASVHALFGADPPNPLPTFRPPSVVFAGLRTNDADDRDDPNVRGAAPARIPTPPPGLGEIPKGPEAPRAVGFANLRVMHAGLDEPYRGARDVEARGDLVSRVWSLDAEFVVVDLGAGTHPDLLALFDRADVALYVTLPEPPAVEQTYRFARALYAHRARRDAPSEAARAFWDEVSREHAFPAPLDAIEAARGRGRAFVDWLEASRRKGALHLVINQTRIRPDLELGDRMRSAAQRRLGLDLEYLGYIDYDDTVGSCTRRMHPLLAESPGTKASKSIERIARRVLALAAGKARQWTRPEVPPNSHHDMLEVERGATDEEIRRAFKRARVIYADDSVAVRGLFDPAGLEAVRRRLEEAYDVLLDPARRRPYETSIFPPDVVPTRQPARDPDEPLPPAPVITPDTEFSGDLLRAVRESLGISVAQVCDKTKIGRNYVEALEADDYGALPAEVYARGFVVEVAKCLKLDHEQVGRTYIKRLRRWVEDEA